MAMQPKVEERKCPDGGKCHHQCAEQDAGCFRVAFCAPFSNAYPDEPDGMWPAAVRDVEAAKTGGPATW